MKVSFAILITITVLFLLVEAYFLIDGIYALRGRNVPVSIFWLDLYSVPIRLSLTCLIIPITIFGVGLRSDKWKSTNFKFVAVILYILIFINGIGLLALSNGILRLNEYQDSLKFEGHTYRIIHSYARPDIATDTRPYTDLFKCDSLGFLCRQIYSYERRSKPTVVWSENHPWQSKLTADPTAHTVTLAINGEAVYVHEVE